MSQAALQMELLTLDEQYACITGHNAFLYADRTNPGAYHFTDDRVVYGVRSALAHMRELLHLAAQEMEEGA
ncbi:hypothetical protein [Streptomyces cinereoruber]|uniref:hypothetical protein n=1 Tax=Streptomyces cinereoruber TaxID=67260 RepID=UPI003C2AE615